MSKFTVKAKICYPVEVVFEHFISLAKEPFNKFDLKNPVGAKIKRVYKKTRNGDIYIETEVVKYEKDKLYGTETTLLSSVYKSTYGFEEIDDYLTEITLTEEQEIYGALNKIGFVFQSFTAKKKMQEKLDGAVKSLEEHIQKESARRSRLEMKANA